VLSVTRVGHVHKALPALRVQVLDSTGHHVKAGVLVRLRLRSGKLSGILAKRTDKNGQVSFSGLTFLSAGQYTLLATVAGVPTVPLRFTIRAS
jgi:hypothetical protein